MIGFQRILLPLDFEEPALPMGLIHEVGGVARRFRSEVIVLHVMRPPSHLLPQGAIREILERAGHQRKELWTKWLTPTFNGINLREVVVEGNPAREILRTARDEDVDLIMMPMHGYRALERLLLGSVTNKVLHGSECPVWTGAHVKDVPVERFAIRNVLCAVDFSPHTARTVKGADEAARKFGAELTLAHVTPSVEIYGPGGHHILEDMRQELVNSATAQMAKIQQDAGTKAAVFITSGDVPKMIGRAAAETGADLIVAGCRSLGGRFGTTAYGIIRESQIPVVSV